MLHISANPRLFIIFTDHSFLVTGKKQSWTPVCDYYNIIYFSRTLHRLETLILDVRVRERESTLQISTPMGICVGDNLIC